VFLFVFVGPVLQVFLYRSLKLKHEPIEWVYDGLAPLLLQEVLYQRKVRMCVCV